MFPGADERYCVRVPAICRYVPCFWSDLRCHRRVEELHYKGTEVPVWLAGHHKNSGSWFKAVGYLRTESLYSQFIDNTLIVVFLLALSMFLLERLFKRFSQKFVARKD